ncbi:1,3-beta-glucan synthase component-domain-containing protein [Suillus ampliporus]|nr:1,3-beta-glucan synthase component-domain-containing protein [Suillus ampliporus]
MSQPAREFIVKIIEMSLWSSDFLLGHILLMILSVPVLIFHVNNILIIYLIQVFMVILLFIGTLNKQLVICQVDSQRSVLGGQQSSGCYNLIPVFDWIKCCIVSIFLVFFIAFLPLFLQELVEHGTGKALLHLGSTSCHCLPFLRFSRHRSTLRPS